MLIGRVPASSSPTSSSPLFLPPLPPPTACLSWVKHSGKADSWRSRQEGTRNVGQSAFSLTLTLP
ncbi:hypothetical protein E2C01_092032 [Portunus trituberculatus]|uniref:Uncharacterized protein n=1 Tax=Portunus trituberculatus TaxID=210409 RepID=A0A5B7JQZ5_PORTR|nr:hypothetical protein [Portunus trituberculatus]